MDVSRHKEKTGNIKKHEASQRYKMLVVRVRVKMYSSENIWRETAKILLLLEMEDEGKRGLRTCLDFWMVSKVPTNSAYGICKTQCFSVWINCWMTRNECGVSKMSPNLAQFLLVPGGCQQTSLTPAAKQYHSFWDYPGGPVVNTVLSLHRAQVRSLVEERRFCMLHDVTKNNNNSFISVCQ